MLKKIIWLLILVIIAIVVWFNIIDLRRTIDNIQLTNINGKTLPLINHKPLLVNIWATDCPSCVTEMPQLQQLYNDYQEQGFRVIAIAMQYDKIELIRNFVQKYHIDFPVVYDSDGQLVKKFGNVNVIPTSFLLDGSGHILQQSIGEPDWEKWRKIITSQFNN